MARHVNDHEPVAVASAIVMTQAHLDDLKAFLTDLVARDHMAPAVLSDNQFEKLIAMLQPGFELSTAMLADYKRQREPLRVDEPVAEREPLRVDGAATVREERQAEDVQSGFRPVPADPNLGDD